MTNTPIKQNSQKNNLSKIAIIVAGLVFVAAIFTIIIPGEAKAIRIGDILDPLHLLHKKESKKKSAPAASPATAVATQGTLSGVCYSTVTDASVGEEVVWETLMEGGNGTYSFVWSGSDGLKGNRDVANVIYKSRGMKRASVRVSSGGQILNLQCNPGVEVVAAIRTVSARTPDVATGSPVPVPAQIIIANAPAPVVAYSGGISGGYRDNSADIAKAVAAIRNNANGAVASGLVYNSPAGSSLNSPLAFPSSVGNTASAANSLGALSIFSLDKVPWTAIIFIIILILLIAIIYQLMSKKS